MRGTNAKLVVTTTYDDATGTEQPLFYFPVQMCKGVDDNEVKLDTAAPSGGAVQRVWRDTATNTIVEEADLTKGVRTGDSFATIDAETLRTIDENLKTDEIRVAEVCDLDDCPRDRALGPVQMLQVPAKGGAHKSYRLTYEALLPAKRKGKSPARKARAMRVSFVSRTRQKLGYIYADADRKCLVLQPIVFATDVREPDEQILSHLSVEVEAPMIEKVSKVLEVLRTGAAPDFESPVDETIAKRRELVEKALVGDLTITAPTAEAAVVKTDELESALEASLAATT